MPMKKSDAYFIPQAYMGTSNMAMSNARIKWREDLEKLKLNQLEK